MSDYLTEEEQVAAIKHWWSENGTSLIIGIVVVIAAVSGWRWYDSNQQAAANSASELYQSYLAELDEPEAGDVETILARIDAELPGTAYQAFSLFYRAKNSAQVQDYDAAIGHLENAVASSEGYSIHDLALIRLAKVYQQVDREEDALAQLEQVRGKGFISVAAELKGDIYRLSGELDKAHAAYTQASELVGTLSQRPLLAIKLNNTVVTDE